MKKIGIFTYNCANNYGAMLQAYALKRIIHYLGAKAALINYLPAKNQEWTLKDYLKKTLFYPWIVYVNYKFALFRKPYLTDMPPVKKANLHALNDQFDLFISGSDQVWNMRGNRNDPSYLLDFVNEDNKKYSYAASLGKTDISCDEKKLISKYIKHFKMVSVREPSTLGIAQDLSGKEAQWHIDPSLLLSQTDWRQIAQMPKEKGYVLLYLMNVNSDIISFAKQLAVREHLTLLMLSTSPLPIKGVKKICPSPQQWLGYFFHATYVVTNSFHGLAFSINLQKNFWVALQPPPSNVNVRLQDLLKLTALENRLVSTDGIFSNSPINWAAVNAKLAYERQRALLYLKEITK